MPEIQQKQSLEPLIKKPRLQQNNEAYQSYINQKKQQLKTAKAKNDLLNLLSQEEQIEYEDRILENYNKIDIFGRGGYSIVWKVLEKNSGIFYAAKQILKQNIQSFENEIMVQKQIQDYFLNKIDIKSDLFIKLYQTKITKKDMWLIYEQGGPTIHKQLYTIQGQFTNGTRTYAIINNELYDLILADIKIFKDIIIKISKALQVLSELKIVHNDLKPENILVSIDEQQVKDLKIIDFGSAHQYEIESNCHMATPEYLPPETMNKKTYISRTWSIDVWSLGVFILEVITGIPVWMSFKCQVYQGSNTVQKQGIFCAKGRAFDKILIKQKNLLENFEINIKKNWGLWEYTKDSDLLLDLLQQMLTWNPYNRISPKNILLHPYLI